MDAMDEGPATTNQPPERYSVGLAAVPLTEVSQHGAPLADAPGQVFAYTHFASGRHDALTITVTTGDAVWQVTDRTVPPGAQPDWCDHVLFGLGGPPPPPEGWKPGAGRAPPLPAAFRPGSHIAAAHSVAGPGGAAAPELTLSVTWPILGPDGQAQQQAAGHRGRVALPLVRQPDVAAGLRAAMLAASFEAARVGAAVIATLEEHLETADARAAAAEGRADAAVRNLTAQQDALFAAAAAVVNEKKALLADAEARLADALAAAAAAPHPPQPPPPPPPAYPGGESQLSPGHTAAGSAMAPPAEPPQPPAAWLDRNGGAGAGGGGRAPSPEAQGEVAHDGGGGYETEADSAAGSGSSAAREEAGVEDDEGVASALAGAAASTQPVEGGGGGGAMEEG